MSGNPLSERYSPEADAMTSNVAVEKASGKKASGTNALKINVEVQV